MAFEPQQVQSWVTSDGVRHDTRGAALRYQRRRDIAALYLAEYPGQVAAAEQFALAAIKLAETLAPALAEAVTEKKVP